MDTHEIRTRFLEFFRVRRHEVLPSDSLVPKDDPTLLFTGAGMNQFKEEFLGRGRRQLRRVATCQKCLRTADIEKVGRTPAHHTFFEMLGNFSFGDYFKEEAITLAWEFLLSEMKIAPENLWASVYIEDDEAFDIWERKIGVPSRKILRFGEEENFWPASAPSQGPNGPCGTCSEIFFDRGPSAGCRRPTCDPSCDCGRFVEIWNLVFTQFDRKDAGVLEPLPQKNIDTGMGLERMAAVMQGKASNFEIDVFQPLVLEVSNLVGIPYGKDGESTSRIRRIADHARAVFFCVADGVLPSNEGRGYVERRLLRRAVADGRFLGKDENFLFSLIPLVTRLMKGAYPVLEDLEEQAQVIVRGEEERFRQTLDQGLALLDEIMEKMRRKRTRELSGEEAFRLHDTFGLPFEMTQAILEEKGFTVNRADYDREMEHQRQTAREASKISGGIFNHLVGGLPAELAEKVPPTKFVGYEELVREARVLVILSGSKAVDWADAGTAEEIDLVVDQTPFYAEAGGQVGDTGIVESGEFRMQVKNTFSVDDHVLHRGSILAGEVKVGDKVRLIVDRERRRKIAINHTATHLLHYALRKVLGLHVRQAGSLVAEDRLRFDFTHYQAAPPELLRRVEDFLNAVILEGHPVQVREMSLEEAKKEGAIALFGEKYGKRVRMVQIDDFSKELCGGTHLTNTGEIGLFRVVSEESVAAGVRRITAVTGRAAYARAKEEEEVLAGVCGILSVPPAEIVPRVEGLLAELKRLRKEVHARKAAGLGDVASNLLSRARVIGETRVLSAFMEAATPDEMRQAMDRIRTSAPSFAAVLASVLEGKVHFVGGCSRNLVDKGLRVDNLLKSVAKIVGGGGGGRADLAQAGGTDTSNVDKALAEAERLLLKSLEG